MKNSVKDNAGITSPDNSDLELINKIAEIPSQVWFEISAWAKETNNLASWQRGIAFSIGRILAQKRHPSRKQAAQGIKIIEEIQRLGFTIDKTETA